MSQWVMHGTKPRRRPDETIQAPPAVLGQILRDGFLRPTFAIPQGGSGKPTVRGPYPAVCFTEQPLKFYLQTVRVDNGSRYTEFAVAFRKGDLFDYGGRSAIYDTDEVLGRLIDDPTATAEALVYEGGLPQDQQYRWVGFDPRAMWSGKRQYPVDWTHEREWRARPSEQLNRTAGLGDGFSEVVPLLLPTRRPGAGEGPRFVILVDTEESRLELEAWVADNRSEMADRGAYWEQYSSALGGAPILSFEQIQTKLERKGNELGRLEDFLPGLVAPLAS